jgi:hypothetical protein
MINAMGTLGAQPVEQPGSARPAIKQMLDAGLLDDVMDRAPVPASWR